MQRTAMLAAGLCASGVLAEPGETIDWRQAESGVLSGHVQLTTRDEFVKAGEAYFSPDGNSIIFQAVPTPEGRALPDPHYSMYVASLKRGTTESGTEGIIGLGPARRISPPNSANTCGWFHPGRPDTVLFGSTLVPPSEDNVPGYQRGTGKYRWSFPTEMELVTARVWSDAILGGGVGEWRVLDEPKVMFTKPGYDAEGSYSPDGRHVLYANVDAFKSSIQGRADADLYVYDTKLEEHRVLIEADGYDGGPFFGPIDDQDRPLWITYRSDRRGDNLLQLFIAQLAYDDPSDPDKITGVKREVQLTDNGHVNWCPWWDAQGRFLVYATSEVGHFNYEVFAINALDSEGEPFSESQRTTARVTHASGFDGLPVFSPDGRHMMWTSQRGPATDGEVRSSSQLWIAEVNADEIALRVGAD
ncbi:MAG: hypothetical protein AAGI53_02410 [Planctomycetota bacterium]